MFDERELVKLIVGAKGSVSVQDMARLLRIRGNDRRLLRATLQKLEASGQIRRVRGKNYSGPQGRGNTLIGRVQITGTGVGFVRNDSDDTNTRRPFEGDLFIPPRDLGGAMDGDLVRAEFVRNEERGPTGRILEVLERAHTRIVGWFQARTARGGEVTPRNRRIDRRIQVPLPPPAMGIGGFDWVEVEIDEFPNPPADLRGRIVGRIGSDTDRGIDVLLVLRDRGIEEEFSGAVEAETKKLRFDWTKDLEGRLDLRELPTITIDPKTAKDFDDALSIERIAEGWRLYVHVADVAHFVRPGTALDMEAQDRATSVYPVDRVVPMLPHKISNYLCSLVPHEDRLAVTAIMDVSHAGEVLRSEIRSTAIHSNYRFAYEEVQALFDVEDGASTVEPQDVPESLEPFRPWLPMLMELRTVAALLRKVRIRRGALDLDIPQTQVLFGPDGKVSGLRHYPRYESNQLIEECMLLANEAVARHLTQKQAPLLFRVHEMADPDRLEKLEPVLKLFGIRLNTRGRITPKDIQAALERAQAHPAGHIVRRLILRALKRAEYTPDNVGHFGLASDYYCHFTSPIRRYPDVVVHRQVKAIEAGLPLPYAPEDHDLEGLGEHTSARERRAQEAEWEAIAIKSLEYMKRFEGEEFDGFITSVQSYGFYVELQPYPVEGLVKRLSLQGDRWDLDETGTKLEGKNSGRAYRLAQKVRVRIERIDAVAQQLELGLVEDAAATAPVFGRRAAPRRRFPR